MSITGNDILNDVRAEIIEPSPTFFSNDRILAIINKAQRKYVAKTRVLQSFAFTSTVQGQADYPMPPDWLGSEEVFYNATTDGITPNWIPLGPTNLTKLAQENPNFLSTASNMQGSPNLFYVIGSTLYLYPKPITSGTNDIFMFYESTAPTLETLNDSLSIDDSLYDGVFAYVMASLWRQDNEPDKAREYMSGDETKPGMFERELGNGRKWKNKRILDGKWKLDIQSRIPFSYSGGNTTLINGINPLNQ